MPENRLLWGGVLVAVLLFANFLVWLFSGWGLITVHAHGMPLSKVIRSIGSQGWVTIYTNIDPTTRIDMDVYRVPLAEAMETLAANIPDAVAAATPSAQGQAPAPGQGPRQGRRGGGGGGAQWKLAFFTASSSALVRQEIRSFQSSSTDDETKIYSYPTPLQMLSGESGMAAADPRLQTWSGVPAVPTPPPAPASDSGAPNPPPDAPAPPSTVQDYLGILAESSDIWIMSPSTWEPKVSSPPGAGSSIAKAVSSLVSRAHGSMEQAFVLYQRLPGTRGQGGGRGFGGGGDTGWAYMEDRLRSAINGLPADARADATSQLNSEIDFQKQVRTAPPDQRRNMMRSHFMAKMAGMDNWRRSPESRAKMYSHAVANRVAVRGQ